MPTTKNPLSELNNKRRFIFAFNSKNFYIRVITDPSDMIERHDCSELLRKMLNMLEYQEKPLEQSWVRGYEERIKSNHRCENENYTYFILENVEGTAVGILSGDIYPNNSSLMPEDAAGINAKNLFIEEEYRNHGFAQMLLSKIFTLIPKMIGKINIIMTGLSEESLKANNLQRYENYASKANLTTNIKEKESGGIYFMTKQENFSYEIAKNLSHNFRHTVANQHSLDILKKSERKGWKYTI